MGAEMLSELGSANVAIDGHAEGPVGTACYDELGDEKETCGQSNSFALDQSDGDLCPVSSEFMELENKQMALSDTDPMLGASIAEGTSSMPCISEGNELIDPGLEKLTLESGDGVLDEMGSSRDILGWTNDTLAPEGGGTGWTIADGVNAPAVPSGPDRVSTPPRRRMCYMVKIPRFVDGKLKNQMKLLELQMEEMNKKREFYRAALQLKRSSKGELLEKLKPARDREKACREVIQGKRMEMEPYQLALNKFRNAFVTTREKGQDLCSSEEQLNERIAYLRHRIEHESIPLKEEKQLLKDIKQLEATRSQVCANMVLQAELVQSVGPKEEIQGHCKLLGSELDALRKEHRQARAEFETVEKEVEALNASIEDLWQHVEKYSLAQKEAYEAFKQLRKKENERNTEFYNYRRDTQSVKELAFQKQLDDLENVCFGQVERILALWNTDAEFRDAYIKNNERSTLRRLETLDGRSLGPDEEPPLLTSDVDTTVDSNKKSERIPAADPWAFAPGGGHKKVPKVINEESKLLANVMKSMPRDSLMEANVTLESRTPQEKLAGYVHPGKPSNSTSKINLDSQIKDVENGVKEEATTADLKEKRRQDQIIKAQEAAERKKKQVQKAHAKALIRAQKDSERREKEKEKRARKKASASAAAGRETDSEDMVSQADSQGVITGPDGIAPDNHNMSRGNETQEVSKASLLPRKKAVGKITKKSRHAMKTPLSKKVVGHLPTWFWVLVVVLSITFLVVVVFLLKKF